MGSCYQQAQGEGSRPRTCTRTTLKAKAHTCKAKDLEIVFKDMSRPRTITNIADGIVHYKMRFSRLVKANISLVNLSLLPECLVCKNVGVV